VIEPGEAAAGGPTFRPLTVILREKVAFVAGVDAAVRLMTQSPGATETEPRRADAGAYGWRDDRARTGAFHQLSDPPRGSPSDPNFMLNRRWRRHEREIKAGDVLRPGTGTSRSGVRRKIRRRVSREVRI
jgi:hypothetical protein